jgi:hypothetical protein
MRIGNTGHSFITLCLKDLNLRTQRCTFVSKNSSCSQTSIKRSLQPFKIPLHFFSSFLVAGLALLDPDPSKPIRMLVRIRNTRTRTRHSHAPGTEPLGHPLANQHRLVKRVALRGTVVHLFLTSTPPLLGRSLSANRWHSAPPWQAGSRRVETVVQYTHSYLAVPNCRDRASPLPASKSAPCRPWRMGSHRGGTVVRSFLPSTPQLLGGSLSATSWQICTASPWRAGSRRGETVVHSFLPSTPQLLGRSLSATRWQICTILASG